MVDSYNLRSAIPILSTGIDPFNRETSCTMGNKRSGVAIQRDGNWTSLPDRCHNQNFIPVTA